MSICTSYTTSPPPAAWSGGVEGGYARALITQCLHPSNRPVTPDDYPTLESVVKLAVKDKQPFERLELPKEALLEMFAVRPPSAFLSLPLLF